MDLGLSGKKAIITGSTRGIGRAIANLLADEGVDLAICSRNQAEVDSAISELSAKGVKVIGAVVDVGDKEAYQAWIASAAQGTGRIGHFRAQRQRRWRQHERRRLAEQLQHRPDGHDPRRSRPPCPS